MKTDRPKEAICPHQCDTCSKYKTRINSKQTTINRVLQSGSTSSEDIEKLREDIKMLKADHEDHKLKVQKSHCYYTEVTKRCSE